MRQALLNFENYIYRRLRVGATRVGYHTRPAFLIIGAQKCGTSALYTYLSRHPHITPVKKKEIHFFDKDSVYHRGLNWYHSYFPLPHELAPHAISFEATPSYFYRPSSAHRIHGYNPEIKLIVLFRNPVDRAFSQWNMYRILIKENREALSCTVLDSILSRGSFHDFDEAVEQELDKILTGDSNPEPSYIRRGLYYDQLTRYLEYFERDQILIIDSRLLKRNPASVLDKVTHFLGASSHNWHREKLSYIHARAYQDGIPEKTQALLREFYKPFNEKLYELIGHDFGWEQMTHEVSVEEYIE